MAQYRRLEVPDHIALQLHCGFRLLAEREVAHPILNLVDALTVIRGVLCS